MRIITKLLLAVLLIAPVSAQADISEYPSQIEEVSIPSTMDQTIQPALFYNSESPEAKPLLVALHTWAGSYDQGGGEVSYATWAISHDWVFIHPHFRGPNTNSYAMGSEYVVSDIIDAVNFAKDNANVDESRIYLVGASGGGYATLLMAARAPEIWAAASAWCPISDIQKWWEQKFLRTTRTPHQYAQNIEAACGGKPGDSPEVDHEYRVRSANTWLHSETSFPIQIATGVHDGRTGSVPFTHSLLAFNEIATPEDRISTEDIRQFYASESAAHMGFEPYFDNLYGRTIHYRKESDNTQVTIFEGTHEILHTAALTWLSNQAKEKPTVWDLPIKLKSKQKLIEIPQYLSRKSLK